MLALDEALAIVAEKEAWNVNDDLCDCLNQRTFSIFNPYHGVTEEVRLCCFFAEMRKHYPQFFRTTVQEPAAWNGESDMPASIWHRQLATELGIPISDARSMGMEPPKGKPHTPKPTFFLPFSGDYIEVRLG